ncbi:lantibiotic dehydratase [Shewanella abyssi]|uniref:lantibiotic dehydratase n=1 Tax=Shewanella abyssi TaxID=311789 RepID=UPI00200BAB4C|nr:lantibiotic dehydratase [Shewanella abyssi]MCL1050915.1 lantibiotic dehydratase [Shewanella abyssi]
MTKPLAKNESFFVIRAPRLPLEELSKISNDRDEMRVQLNTWLDMPGIQEALYLASPALIDSLPQWREKPDSKQAKKTEQSLIKYLIRMSSRPTPFGLFSGVALGKVTQDSRIVTEHYLQDSRKTRLDMFYLGALKSKVASLAIRDDAMRYSPNSSHYFVAEQCRYIESYQSNDIQQYRLSAITTDEYFLTALRLSTQGISFSSLVEQFQLAHPAATTVEIEPYVEQLITESILVPKLPLPLTGDSPDSSLMDTFNAIEKPEYADQLATGLFHLQGFDQKSTVSIKVYQAVTRSLSNELVKPDEGKLFQTDIMRQFSSCELSQAEIDTLAEHLNLLHKSHQRPYSPFTDFIQKFNQRFEGQFVPLDLLLDEESGIGFSAETGYEAPLIAGINLGRQNNRSQTEAASTLLELEIERAYSAPNMSTIDTLSISATNLTKQIKTLKEDGSLPASFAAMVSGFYDQNGKILLKYNGCYGPSAANLLGRFCHLDDTLKTKVIVHLKQEERHSPEVIFAEIAHVPEGRPGNVIARPHLRDYEITFMADSSLDENKQITLSDLYVWVENDEVKLWSKKLNKQVVPRLSCAHNYSDRSLSAYKFLSMLQNQSMSLPRFSKPTSLDNAVFCPRIMLDNLILAEKSWQIPREDLEKLYQAEQINDRQWSKLQQKYRLENWVLFAVSDHVLQLDLTNPAMLAILLSESKGLKHIPLKEVLSQTLTPVVSNAQGQHYNSEIIIPFFNEQATKLTCLHENPLKNIEAKNITRRFAPGSEWLSLKIYSGNTTVENLLSEQLLPLIEQHAELFNKWFFIRYGDPDWHIRLRFQGSPEKLYGQLLPLLNSVFEPMLATNQLHRVEVSTYEREVERYGGPDAMELVEALFMADSQLIAAMLQQIDEHGEDMRWRLATLSCNKLFNIFDYSDDDTLSLLTRLRTGFGSEFNESAMLRKQLGNRFREKQQQLEDDMAKLGNSLAVAETALSPSQLELHKILQQWQVIADPIIANIKLLQKESRLTCSFDTLINSLLHMHNNRVFKAYNREQELVVHDFTRRFYFSKIQRNKNNH